MRKAAYPFMELVYHTSPGYRRGKETPPMLRIIEETSEGKGWGLGSSLDDLAREGTRRMLMSELDAEVGEYVERYRSERDEAGRALVVRNGKARPRKVTLGAGTVDVSAPRVHDRRAREQFTSKILPPYMRRSPKVSEVLPVLYLRGLSTGDSRGVADPIGR
jgi:transposase-like protein